MCNILVSENSGGDILDSENKGERHQAVVSDEWGRHPRDSYKYLALYQTTARDFSQSPALLIGISFFKV